MTLKTRRSMIPVLFGAAGALLTRKASAQVQTVGNRGQIVATGDVYLDQDAAGNQVAVFEDAFGRQVTQVVTNDTQIVATGDVVTRQRASGNQEVYVSGGGQCECDPGDFDVFGDGVSICTIDCCWEFIPFPVCRPEPKCKKGRC